MKGRDVKYTEVAIVGGGLAGLVTARLLSKAGVDFLLIEARDRLGGRILTMDEYSELSEDGFDLGPSWYWPQMQPAIAALVEELALPSFCQNSDGDVIFERMSRERPHRLRGLAQEQQSMRLVGGSAALIRGLARDLPKERILLGTRVTAMALMEDSAELTLELADGSSETRRAGRVVAALPPRLLEAIVNFTPELEPAIAALWRGTPTWMAPHAKFFAIYDRPFWREAGLSGTAQSMVGPMVEMHDATTASGGAALFGFLGVGAEQRASMGEEALARACLDQFTRIFGHEAAHPRATLLKDWAADPFTATQDDRSAGGHAAPTQSPWVPGPWRDRLVLAGSEASPTEPGYLSGAVTAAVRAVDHTLTNPTPDGRRG